MKVLVWPLHNKPLHEIHFQIVNLEIQCCSPHLHLHKELLSKHLIKDGKHHHEWVWNTTVGNGFNSFNYLGRLLALNMLPMKYWLPLDRNSVSWENLEHYIVGVKNPKNQISIPNNARVIEDIVKKLMEEHDKRPLTEYKDLD